MKDKRFQLTEEQESLNAVKDAIDDHAFEYGMGDVIYHVIDTMDESDVKELSEVCGIRQILVVDLSILPVMAIPELKEFLEEKVGDRAKLRNKSNIYTV